VPWIEIRDSQHKYTESRNFAFELEIVRWSTPGVSAQIGKQVLQVLSERGVPNEVFTKILDMAIAEKTEGLLAFNDFATFRRSIEIAGKVKFHCSKLPAAAPDAQVLLRTRSYGDVHDEDIDLRREISTAQSDDATTSNDDSINLHSGLPRLPAEQLLCMLDNGFEAMENMFMLDKLEKLIANVVDNCARYHLPVARSTTLYVFADPVGCLAEDEIYVQVLNIPKDHSNRRRTYRATSFRTA